MQRADLLVALGARFDDRVTGKLSAFAPDAKIVHVDIDPAEIGKNRVADVPIVGDCRDVISKMTAELDKRQAEAGAPDRSEWLTTLQDWQTRYPLRYAQNGDSVKPQYCVERLRHFADDDTILVSGVGQHQMYAAQYWRFERPRHWINSGGLGTMGFAVPAAMGAKVGQPDKRVVAIDGDGCFQMTAQELATSNTEQIPFITAILNNGYLGMVRQWQELFFDERYSGVYLDPNVPDYVKLAEAYGAVGLRVESPEEVDAAIEKAYAVEDRSVVIDFRVDPREGVFPMVAAGTSNDDIILGPEFAPHEIPGEAPIV
jgi:acetolactate synthase-1/2/3 large subunit